MAGHCEPNCPVEGGLYSYNPNLGGNAFLLAVYAALIPIVLYFGFRYRTRAFAVTLSSGLLFELLGFIGRVLLHGSRGNEGYFFLAHFGTVLGPTLISTSMFLILPHLFSVYGENAYPFRPRTMSFIFYGFAALTFLLELIGVVLVAYGFDGIGRTKGADVTAAGLAIQSVLLLTFSGLHFWFTLGISTASEGVDEKYLQVYSSPRFKWFQLVLQVDTLLLAVYSIYRLVEFSGGVASQLFQNEAAFMIIGGAFPLIVCLLLTAFHPGRAFGDAWSSTSSRAHTRRGPPEPIDTGLPIHHRYDPEIRKQISPMSGKNQPGSLSPPQPPAGSPGLPANPKPVMSPTNMRVSMTEASTRSSSAQDQYAREQYFQDQYTHEQYVQDQYTAHVRQERQSQVPKNYIVRDDELW